MFIFFTDSHTNEYPTVNFGFQSSNWAPPSRPPSVDARCNPSAPCIPGAVVRPRAIRIVPLSAQPQPQQQQQQRKHVPDLQQQAMDLTPKQGDSNFVQAQDASKIATKETSVPSSFFCVDDGTSCENVDPSRQNLPAKVDGQRTKLPRGRPRKSSVKVATRSAVEQQEDISQDGSKGRTTYKVLQIQVLEEVFSHTQYPDGAEIQRLAMEMGISKTKIKVCTL